MNKTLRIFLLAILSLYCRNIAIAESLVNVELSSGDVISFSLNKEPKITYSDYSVTVTYDGGSIEYQMSDIKRLTLGNTNTGVNDITQATVSGDVSFENGAFHFVGFPKNSSIFVYSLKGILIRSYNVSEEGSLTVSTDDFEHGTYIIKASNVTYKFNKQ